MNTILKLYSFFVATEQIDSAEIMQMLCEIGFPDFQGERRTGRNGTGDAEKELAGAKPTEAGRSCRRKRRVTADGGRQSR